MRLPNTLNVGIDGVSGADLLAATPSVAASTGSACHSSDEGPSTGLLALGLGATEAASALRMSVGRWTTEDDVDAAARALAASAR
jgi:cysteine desulfurase